MVELNIQVPDELAQRLEPFRNRIPELLTRLIETLPPRMSPADSLLPITNPTNTPLAYAEVLDFLIARPTPQEIAAFKVSTKAQAYTSTLLDKNREGMLNETEAADLDLYEQLEHLMILLKAKAYPLIE